MQAISMLHSAQVSAKKIAMRIDIKHVHTRSATTPHREELKIEVINFAAIKNIIMSQLRVV